MQYYRRKTKRDSAFILFDLQIKIRCGSPEWILKKPHNEIDRTYSSNLYDLSNPFLFLRIPFLYHFKFLFESNFKNDFKRLPGVNAVQYQLFFTISLVISTAHWYKQVNINICFTIASINHKVIPNALSPVMNINDCCCSPLSSTHA